VIEPATVNPRVIATVIIPAHNEAAVIGRLLESLPKSVGGGRVHVIVSCNGCTDDTADVARGYGATVIEVKAASKIAALNAADSEAVAFPRIYVDADVVLTDKTIIDLINALSSPDLLCAAPPARLVLDARPWTVRAYFSVWTRVMRARNGHVGSGVYALSEAGRKRFGRFPDVIADDTFVRNVFAGTERRVVQTEPTIVETPRTLRALFRRRVRVCIGNSQLFSDAAFRELPGNSERAIPLWRVVLTHPTLIPASTVYATVNALAYLAASRQLRSARPVDWGRDDTSRQP